MENIQNAAVLLVEDHRDLAITVSDYLQNLSYIVDFAEDGLTAVNLATANHYDVIILDIMLPGLDGFQVCEQLREKAQLSVPIIMLTARDQLDDKLQGFAQGADDYLVKPFELAELEARIAVLIRRSRGEMDRQELSVHDLVLNTRTLEVTRAGQSLKLSPTCLRILKILLRESPNIVTREALERELWGDLLPDSDTLRSHLYNLRKVIDKPFDKPLMQTIPGIGFKISLPG